MAMSLAMAMLTVPSTRRASAPRALFSFLFPVGLAVVAAGSNGALAQGAAPALSDPQKVVVIVDDAGDVGIMISNAQLSHEMVVNALRKRLGRDAVAYEGQRKNAETMKRMLGSNAETTMQDTQLAWFDQALKAAPWRVRVRFGTKKGEHFVVATCRKAGEKTDLDTRTGTGKNFAAAKDALSPQLDAFCPVLPTPAVALPIEGASPSTTPSGSPSAGADETPPGMQKKKKPKAWTPPPRRD